MSRIEVDVDIHIEHYLYEVSTEELIDELKSRNLSAKELIDIKSITSKNQTMPKGIWKPLTEDQEQLIKDQYLQRPIKQIASDIGITFGRVMRFLDRNGLDLPQEIRDQRKRDSQRKKGDTAYNKGMKQTEFMSPEAIERTKATRFQKGNIPPNTHYDGKISIRNNKDDRPYKYVRVSLGEWKLLHHVIWEEQFGKIPEGMIIAFKDGDTFNTSIENLEMISMIENMLRNSRHNYPKEIIPSMVLNTQLQNKLKSLQNG